MGNDELSQHLESLRRESCYRVDAVLKESPHEVTQRVFFVGENGAETGPYIRKFIRTESGFGSAYRRMFEAQRAGRRFKFIPDILECYSRDGQMVVIMECVRGNTLQEAVYQSDPSLAFAANAFPLICDAVTELHTEFDPPIIHRDLKPSNIILTGRDLALIDFGISREYHEQAECDTTHFGTREFAPPEQYGFGQTGVYSDVYSLGMVLYFCLTERIPDSQARKDSFRDPAIPEPVRKVIEKATALDPSMRCASAADLKRAFVEAVACVEERPDMQAAGNAAPGRRTRTSRRPLAIGVAIAAIAMAALAIALAIGPNAKNDNAPSADSPSAGTPSSTTTAPDGSKASSAPATEAEGAPNEPDIVKDLEITGPPKDGFDPKTNFLTTVADVTFQIPSYFKMRTAVKDDSGMYYYAETGSSTAMIMTSETRLEADETDANIDDLKDSYVQGVVNSGDSFTEILSSTDCELAGHPTRVITFSGTAKGIPLKGTLAFFYNSKASAIGSVLFGQTTNAQFDYSRDFARVITSATPE